MQLLSYTSWFLVFILNFLFICIYIYIYIHIYYCNYFSLGLIFQVNIDYVILCNMQVYGGSKEQVEHSYSSRRYDVGFFPIMVEVGRDSYGQFLYIFMFLFMPNLIGKNLRISMLYVYIFKRKDIKAPSLASSKYILA